MLTLLLRLQESKPGSSPKARRNNPQGYQNASACILPDLSKSPRVDISHAVSWVPSWAHPRVETPLLWRAMPKIYGSELLTLMCDAKLCVQPQSVALVPGHSCPTGSSYSSGQKMEAPKDGRKPCSK